MQRIFLIIPDDLLHLMFDIILLKLSDHEYMPSLCRLFPASLHSSSVFPLKQDFFQSDSSFQRSDDEFGFLLMIHPHLYSQHNNESDVPRNNELNPVLYTSTMDVSLRFLDTSHLLSNHNTKEYFFFLPA